MGSQYSISQNKTPSVLATLPHKNETFALTESGDISFGDSGRTPQMISGLDKLKQDVMVILRSLKGSSPFRSDLGLDMFAIVENEYDPLVIENEVEAAVLKHPELSILKGFKVSKQSTQANESSEIRQHYFIEFFAESIDNQMFFVSVSL